MSLQQYNKTGLVFYLDPEKINLIRVDSQGITNKIATIAFSDCASMKLGFESLGEAYDWINDNLI